MRTITAIEPQKSNPQRVNLFLDGEYAFGISEILTAWLKVGQEISEEKIASLLTEDSVESAYKKALHFLSFRSRSSMEVRRNLVERGTTEAVIEQVLTRLEDNGLINDEHFSLTWIENRNTFHPRSKMVLGKELKQKGINPEKIQAYLDKVDDEELALSAARKQARRYTGLEWPKFRQRMSGYLARRGFNFFTINPVIFKVWEELQTADAGNITEKGK